MNDVTLITVSDISEITSISKNVAVELLSPYIVVSEETFVYDLLGVDLTSQLKDQLTGNTLSSLNQTLLTTYIRPLAAFGAWFEASPFIHYKTVNKGFVKQSSDNSSNADLNEVAFIRQALKDKIDFFQGRLKDYLEANKASFPLYKSTCSNNDYNPMGVYLGN